MKVSDSGLIVRISTDDQTQRAKTLAEKYPLKYEYNDQKKRFYYIAYPPESAQILEWILEGKGDEPSGKSIFSEDNV